MNQIREVVGKRWAAIVLRWWVCVVIWFASCSFAVMVWDGTRTRMRTFEDLVADVNVGGPNSEAAIVALQAKVLTAMRAIRERENFHDRAAKIAAAASQRFHKETSR